VILVEQLLLAEESVLGRSVVSISDKLIEEDIISKNALMMLSGSTMRGWGREYGFTEGMVMQARNQQLPPRLLLNLCPPNHHITFQLVQPRTLLELNLMFVCQW
jgi:hypothetical protein